PVLSARRTAGGRLHDAAARPCRAGSLRGPGQYRGVRHAPPGRAHAGVLADRTAATEGARALASDDAGGRAAGATPYLVEFRLVAQGPHRAGQGGLAGGPLQLAAPGQRRVHSASGFSRAGPESDVLRMRLQAAMAALPRAPTGSVSEDV